MPLPQNFKEIIAPYLTPPIVCEEDTVILKPNEIAEMGYWPVKGYSRSYVKFKPEEDREHYAQKTINISLPGKMFLPAGSCVNKEKSGCFIEIARGSTMVGFSYASFLELSKQIPGLALMAIEIMAAREKDWTVKMEMCKVKCWDGYQLFLDFFGNPVKYFIDQGHIANYIGMSQSELSRLKKRNLN